MTSQKIPSEHVEQVNFVNWVKYNYPEIRLFSVPNGGSRNIVEAKKLKAEGATKGVPDLMIPELFLFIEMKKIKGGRASAEQKDWLKYLVDVGYTAEICNGAAEAKEVFLKTLTGLISK